MNHRSPKGIFLILLAMGFGLVAGAQIAWPPVVQETKPWARWWWQGSAVNEKDLTANLQDYKKAGLGGLEITPVYGVKGFEQEFLPFLSPQWMNMLAHTLKEAKRLDLGIDLANGTGWPFGGPWINEEDASKTVYYTTCQLNSGEELSEAIVYKPEAFVRTANTQSRRVEEIIQHPLAANKDLQALALDHVRFPHPLLPQTVLAYPETGTPLDVTSKVDAKGRLRWKAPEGRWTVYALFQGLHGKMVERAAPGGEGYAIDHFSATALRHYLRKFDTAFRGNDLSYIRAFFNDSYEVDDARGQANWTPHFFAEFQKRRAYDLRHHLPALFQKDSAEKNKRVLYDYRATIDELILEQFTQQWKKWGHAKGARIRNQSHGSPANLLDLYGAVDIPETEGDDILRFKFATSAAHVTGKRLVSSESATWLNEHFLSSWGDVKKALDLFLLGGVNHIFYHGVAYTPQSEPWPGWLFYAAVHFNQANPQWKDFYKLNEYITRCQSFLQSGRPHNEVLLYFPLADRYSDPGKELLQHFDGMGKEFGGTAFEQASLWMQEQGYGFDFFSDRQLRTFAVSGSHIQAGGNEYRVVLLPGNEFIPEKTWDKLMQLAGKGAQILVYKTLPKDVPGYHRHNERRTLFQHSVRQLKFAAAEKENVQQARWGKGVFLLSDDLDDLLQTAGLAEESMVEKGLQFVRRKHADGYTYFISNRSDKGVNDWVRLHTEAQCAALFDPMTGNKGLAKWRKQNGSKWPDVWVQLQPHESIIVQTFSGKRTGPAYPYMQPMGNAQELTGPWTLRFLNGGPVLPPTAVIDRLGSWTELAGAEGKNFSGTARYTTTFSRPAVPAPAYLLNLGTVKETAEVFLNGKKIATLIGPHFQAVLPAADLRETNTLEVVVANLMANRIAYMDREGLEWKKFYNINMSTRKKENLKNGVFDASGWEPLPSGLIGPVTLRPVQKE